MVSICIVCDLLNMVEPSARCTVMDKDSWAI